MKLLPGSMIATSLVVSLSVIAAEQKTSLPRESGAVHAAFIEELHKSVKDFESGFGKIALEGSAGLRRCDAELFVAKDATFVTLEIGSLNYHQEFYIDHPTQSFKNILFQTVVKDDDETAIIVDKRNGGFAFYFEDDSLRIRTSERDDNTICKFSLSKAELFDGVTE